MTEPSNHDARATGRSAGGGPRSSSDFDVTVCRMFTAATGGNATPSMARNGINTVSACRTAMTQPIAAEQAVTQGSLNLFTWFVRLRLPEYRHADASIQAPNTS